MLGSRRVHSVGHSLNWDSFYVPNEFIDWLDPDQLGNLM